ncbi:MAG: neutral/alkaline non-lysosomal ceramidase N-terminal domain-containing protein [Verrucomicrobiia bacterium]
MKTSPSFVVVRATVAFTLLWILVSGSTAAEPKAPPLRAGAFAMDITPKVFPLSMPGLFTARMAESAHDPFYARAIVLDNGVTTVALVVVDNIGMPQEVTDEAKAIASKRCGIPVEKMLVSATHTHTGPLTNVKTGPAPAVAYRKVLVNGIAESIVRAHAALRPAGVGAAACPLPEEVFCRRWFLKPGKMQPNPFGQMDQVRTNPGTNPDVIDRPAGPTDPDVTILSVQDAKSGKPLAVLANYSLHYVGAVPDGILSADYFGEFARVMQARMGGGDFVAMMSNGTSGDINNTPFLVKRPPRKPFEQIQIIAGKTAEAASRARDTIATHRQDARLAMIQRQVTLKLRHPTAEQIAAAKAVLAVKDKAQLDKLPRLAEAYANRTLSQAKAPETVTVLVQALQIGDLAICSLPFEAFAQIGLDLKKRSPLPHTMVIDLANGTNGYLPTPEQHKLGGYETWLGSNRVQEDASVILTDNLLEMLNDLKKATAESSAAEVTESKSAMETDPQGWADILPPADLKGWYRVPVPPAGKLGREQWHLDAGKKVLICDGDGGHDMLLTEKEYGDAIFHFEFCYTKVEGKTGYNSGAYVRNSKDGAIWHQAQFGDAKDGFLFGQTPALDGKKKFFSLAKQVTDKRVKPVGEWNMMEITARGKTLTLWVNGAVTCQFSECAAEKGHLGLEGEGYRIEFRNVKVKPLK